MALGVALDWFISFQSNGYHLTFSNNSSDYAFITIGVPKAQYYVQLCICCMLMIRLTIKQIVKLCYVQMIQLSFCYLTALNL